MTRRRIRGAAWLLATAAGALAAAPCLDEGGAPRPHPRFIASHDGTVRDVVTGLMWKQCPEGLSGPGCATGGARTFTWAAALRLGRTPDWQLFLQLDQAPPFAGHADWRLPDRAELLSLLEPRCLGLDIDAVTFPNTPAAPFWTATPAPYYGDSAWTVHFGSGAVQFGTRFMKAHVRLVRDADAP